MHVPPFWQGFGVQETVLSEMNEENSIYPFEWHVKSSKSILLLIIDTGKNVIFLKQIMSIEVDRENLGKKDTVI